MTLETSVALAPAAGLLRTARRAAKFVLAKVNLKLERVNAWSEDDRCYLPFKSTVAAAKAMGVGVGDYIEARFDVPGVAMETLARMREFGVFASPVHDVCEIGPGSGRYLRETIRMCQPASYEIYETSPQWAEWLVREYKVVLRPTDGRSLASTPSGSIDLIHAHKVFPVISFLSSCRYLQEMARVVRVGGKVVFDVMTEDCINPAVLDKWLESGIRYHHYPNAVPKRVVTDLLAELRLRCDGEFQVSMSPGVTQYFVATKCV
jgi:hypothetical protein